MQDNMILIHIIYGFQNPDLLYNIFLFQQYWFEKHLLFFVRVGYKVI